MWGIKKHTKMCFAITFVKLDGFWTNLADCFLSKFCIKQCKQILSELSTSFVLSAETWKSLIQQRTCTLCTGRIPSSCYDVKPQISLDQMSGQRIHQTSIQLTIGSGGWYKNASIRQLFGTSMIWSSALPVSGQSWSKASLIKPLNSGGQGWELAFAQRDNILNSC